MKKLILLAFITAITVTGIYAGIKPKNDEITGEWKYEVPNAAYGYQKGVFIISEKEGALVGEVKFEDGNKIELKNITYEEGTFKCGLYIDYDYISLNIKVSGNEMKGTVETPDSKLEITAKKDK